MKPLSLQEIRTAVGGKALTPLPKATPPILAVCTDTRRMEPSSLFVALRGDNFNANNFIPQAAAGGAIAALVDQVPDVTLPNVHLIKVDDTRVALGKLARHVRKQMSAKVIGVAGSNGKTSTKHLIHAALSAKLRGSISPKSFNNDIGVPLTIFPADPFQDYLVLEMGTNHPGEIKNLADMALPDVGVITSIGAEHLEGLGDLRGVRAENASLISGLNPRGAIVINGDDPELRDAVEPYEGVKITFGFEDTNDLFATDVVCREDGTTFNLNNSRRGVFVPMLGRHAASNALAALAVARRMGVPEELAVAELGTSTKPEMRLSLHKIEARGITLVNDAYNANPSSMRAALETVKLLPCTGRRIAILGDMRELGDATDRYHREIGEFAAACDLDHLICVGEKAQLYGDAAKVAGLEARAVAYFPEAKKAAPYVCDLVTDGDLVLIKASRSMRLEDVAKPLTDAQQHAARAPEDPSQGFFLRLAAG
ncbi:MAG TPA: UDP-N-acetylmuramoyl-tripeptide--D-alanyl-D-alanine ligase [Tepidisphaeraceae bacterium]|nr:UDP-N-acetylmuramoyl-tripeptide--D-alanyl-D-alanine ligase [Tepidisphaeraceae bacterium]